MKAPWHILLVASLLIVLISDQATALSFYSRYGYTDHQQITREGLNFLKPEVRNRIAAANKDADVNKAMKEHSEYHFDNCRFEETTQNIKDEYADILRRVNLKRDTDSQKLFGIVLHAVQDFYSHSNWIELRQAGEIPDNMRLIDESIGPWAILEPPDLANPRRTLNGVMVLQGTDADFTLLDLKFAQAVPNVILVHEGRNENNPPSVWIPGLITGTYNNEDSSLCPASIAIEHGALLSRSGGLNKDFSGRDGYAEARQLAVEQTTHEWCRLVNLIVQEYGEASRSLLFTNWVDDSDLATQACLPPVSSGGLADSAWPSYRHDSQNTGRSPFSGPASPKVKWVFPLEEQRQGPGTFNSPVFGVDGTLYVGSNQDSAYYAINTDGTVKWRFPTNENMGPSGVVAADGTIYFGTWGTHGAKLYALNADGTEKWSIQVGATLRRAELRQNPPMIGPDGTVYAVTNGTSGLFAFDANGNQKWAFPGGGVSPAISIGGAIYLADFRGVFAVGQDGVEIWHVPAPRQGAPPSIGVDGIIYASVRGDFYTFDKLYALRPNGSEIWVKDYVSAHKAIDVNGSVISGDGYSPLITVGGVDGKQITQYLAGKYITSPPTIDVSGTVYVGYEDGVRAVNPDGTLKWVSPMSDRITSSPVIGVDGTLYVAGRKLYAIGGSN